MLGNKSSLVCTTVLAAVFFGSCGGRQGSTPSPCEDGYNKIMERNDAEICDPQQMNLLEMQVSKWRNDCKAESQGEMGKKVNAKFDTAQSCSESKRRLESVHVDCMGRLGALADGSASCLADSCAPFSNGLTEISKVCETEELKGAFSAEIAELKAKLDERTQDAERLGDLNRVAAFCAQIVEITEEKQANATVDQILHEVTESASMKETPKPASEMERYQRMVSGSCDVATLKAAEVIIPKVSLVLDDKKVAPNSKKWLKELDKLNGLQKRLTEAGDALFPESVALLQTTIAKYAPQGNPGTATGPLSAAAEAAPVKEMSTAQCKTLKKKAGHYENKVAEHQQKGNAAKVKAYQAKLDATNAQLAGCGEEVNATEAPKAVDAAPAEKAPAEPATQTAPKAEAEPSGTTEAPKAGAGNPAEKAPAEKTKPVASEFEEKPAEQPKSAEQPKPAEQPKSSEKPQTGTAKPAEQPKTK